MTEIGPYGASRTPLDAAAVRAAAVRPGGLWRTVEVTAVTGSTNADLLARAAAGEPEGAVLAAEHQSEGRGRLGRTWTSPPRAALTFSVLLRPSSVPRARLGWLPLLAGVAVAAAVRAVAAVDAQLKWPNDVLAGPAANALAGGSGPTAAGGQGSAVVPPGKLAGILAEAAGDAVVVGIGVNVSTGPAELPPPGPGGLAATSLAIEGAAADRAVLLAEILAGLERRYRAWSAVFGDTERSGLRAEYTGLCGTLGRRVRVELPGGRVLDGVAAALDTDGRLLVSVPPAADLPVAAGDIVHLR
ncbi:MAG TPA: biotin--[acetyl-CoA-carboxylase] ligase [Streptosporangiaceae bacterium]|nr:biotin--[acetyl-CoA-carboxylase] ligase [Streptosporangiaceae bacterium]